MLHRSDAVRLVVQPIVDLAGAAVAGHEVLARFDGPPTATPDVWFAAAHRVGLGVDLDALVVTRALDLLDTLPADTFLTVNVSPLTLAAGGLDDLLDRRGDWSRLVVEITEETPSGAVHASRARLRDAGALVALDDAGSGYSGLQQLLDVRPDIVKLDRRLIAGLDGDPAKYALVRMVGELAGSLDAWLLAEGVERPAELSALLRLGVPLAQGWLLGRPGPAWGSLDGTTRDLLRAASPPAEAAVTVGALSSPAGALAVALDDAGRPRRHLLPRQPARALPVLAVSPDTPAADALGRALLRPADRWALPVVVTDERGRAIGSVGVDALMRAVLDSATAPTPPTSWTGDERP